MAEQERKARAVSDALRETLRRVLDVTFDASCDCDEAGRIVFSSSHLQELLGHGTSELVGFDLVQLASCPLEAGRINSLLGQISAQRQKLEFGGHVPLAQLETTLACKDGHIAVKLCCVPFPVNDAPIGSAGRGNIFVGLQVSHQEDLNHHARSGASGMEDSDVGELPKLSASTGIGHAVPGLCVKRNLATGVAISDDTESLASLSVSLTSLPSLAADWSKCYGKDIATQTEQVREALPRAAQCSPPLPGTAKPPRADKRTSRKPPRTSCESAQKRRIVILNTKQTVLRQFKATDNHTISQLIGQTMARINARGSGCCSWHIGLAVLHQRIAELTKQGCLETFAPHNSWQCWECLAMNDDVLDVSDDGDDQHMCAVCDAPAGGGDESDREMPSDVSSTRNADDEQSCTEDQTAQVSTALS